MAARKAKTTTKRAPRKTATKTGRTATATSTERRADRELVERTIDLLQAHERKRAEGELSIGLHVLDEYFAGDAERARGKSPDKAVSYALLVERVEAETDWDEGKLRHAVVMAIAYRSLSASIRDAIKPTYLRRLGSIDDLARRRELAAGLAAGKLGPEAFEEAVRIAGTGERGGGRRAAPAPLRLTAKIEQALDAAHEAGALGKRELDKLDDEARKASVERLRALVSRLQELLRTLRG